MQHLDEGTIHSWLDGALSGDEAAHVEAHVKECPQCAAAVAEARGFIAGSSRILTALDNAPRGVIPATVPRKRIDPFVWRVAATVLVVAAGTLAVFQNRGSDESSATISAERAPLMPHPTSSEDAAVTTAPTTASPSANVRAGRASDAAPTSEPGKAPSMLSKSAAVDEQRADGSARARRTSTVEAGSSAGPPNPVSPDYAKAAAPPMPEVAQSFSAGAVAMDLAREPERLKVVGTPGRIGMKVTLYEVAPGDTVTLTEPTPVSFNAVVATGAAIARTGASREKTMMAPSAARTEAAAAVAPDSQRGAVLQTAPVATSTPTPPAPVKQVEIAGGVTTISWVDTKTGNLLKLSGRMPAARLQQIKIMIERERVAGEKKTP